MQQGRGLKNIGMFTAFVVLMLASVASAETLTPSARVFADDASLSMIRTVTMDFTGTALDNAAVAPVWEKLNLIARSSSDAPLKPATPKIAPASASIFGFFDLPAQPQIGTPVTGELSTALLVSAGLLGLTHLSGSRARS